MDCVHGFELWKNTLNSRHSSSFLWETQARARKAKLSSSSFPPFLSLMHHSPPEWQPQFFSPLNLTLPLYVLEGNTSESTWPKNRFLSVHGPNPSRDIVAPIYRRDRACVLSGGSRKNSKFRYRQRFPIFFLKKDVLLSMFFFEFLDAD